MQEFICPRNFFSDEYSHWREDGTCSYCGSIKPEVFINKVRAHAPLTPTDKNYKVYVEGTNKFYFYHLGKEDAKEFVRLWALDALNLESPGYFYNTPALGSALTKEDVKEVLKEVEDLKKFLKKK